MKVGDKIGHLRPTFGAIHDAKEDRRTFPATVVYIHPEGRFFSVEFELPRGRKCCESFYFENRQGAATPRKENEHESNQHRKSKRRRR